MGQADHPALKGVRSTVIGIFISMALAIIKSITGNVGNSFALIADAIESAADVFTPWVLLFGL
jgi:divalent metal cation (Fe/Co/Zn/Cd) transporter